MTAYDLYKILKDLTTEELDMEILATHGASGATYSIGSLSSKIKSKYDDCGDVIDLKDGAKYLSLYIGN